MGLKAESWDSFCALLMMLIIGSLRYADTLPDNDKHTLTSSPLTSLTNVAADIHAAHSPHHGLTYTLKDKTNLVPLSVGRKTHRYLYVLEKIII